jgi:hypothetical protein
MEKAEVREKLKQRERRDLQKKRNLDLWFFKLWD